MTDMTYLIAQATSAPAGGSTSSPGGGTTAPSGSLGGMLPAMILAMVVFYFLIFRGQKKERKKHEDMLKQLKKNDRIQTIGGILGVVVDVRDHEVIVKVDEASNTRIRFNRAAIKEVLIDAPPTDVSK